MTLAPATVVGRGNRYSVQHGDDSALIVRFYFNKVKEADYIKINVPGDSKTEWDRPVADKDKERFRPQWEAYQAKQNQYGKETLLEDSGLFNEHQIKTYQAFNIYTVENLANVSDAFITKIGPGVRGDQKKARLYLADIKDKAKEQALEQELKKRDYTISSQEERIQALEAKLAEVLNAQEVPRKKPGPKPKVKRDDTG